MITFSFKQAVVAFSISGYLFFSTIIGTQAHQESSSINLHAIMHISPNDEPVALQLSKIEISANDPTGTFDFANCNCSLIVQNDGIVVSELPLEGSGTQIETSFTFSNSGDYMLIFTGTSLNEPHFEDFEIPFAYTVQAVIEAESIDRSSEDSTASSSTFSISFFILILLAAVTLWILLKKRRLVRP